MFVYPGDGIGICLKTGWAFAPELEMGIYPNRGIFFVCHSSVHSPVGSLFAASGPFDFFLRLPTRVGTGGSYLRFSWHKKKETKPSKKNQRTEKLYTAQRPQPTGLLVIRFPHSPSQNLRATKVHYCITWSVNLTSLNSVS